jgi:hypothetical protein
MSLLAPSSRADVTAGNWAIGASFLCPIVLGLVFFWDVFFTPDAHRVAMVTATLLVIPVTVMLIRRAYRLAESGLHPSFQTADQMKKRQKLAAGLGVWALLYGWALLFMGLALPFTAASEKRSFVVSEVIQCARRCLGCEQQLRLRDWPGRHYAKLCADHLGPGLQSGESLTMRGRFSDLALYIDALERA